MKIYSWNILYRTKKPEQAFEYIKNLDFDVLCLQEVPEHFLTRLKTLPHALVSETDAVFLSGKKTQATYNVILSRHPIRASGGIVLPHRALPLRAFLLLKAKTGWSGFQNHTVAYADIDIGKEIMRVFCAHLTLFSSPSHRRRELGAIKDFLPHTLPAIVAGDFNIIEWSLMKPLNWVLGSSLSEAMPWRSERVHAEAHFEKLRLKNPLRGTVTHGFSGSQLDHILVPEDAKVLKAEVIKNTYGSDHHPVFVEVSL